MPQRVSVFPSSTPLFLLMVSFFGLGLIAGVTVSPPVSREDFIWRKPLVGSMLASVCALGILAVFFPNECSRVFNFGHKGTNTWNRFYGFRRGSSVSQSDFHSLRGHHPTCGCFSSHVFHIGGRIFCATCSGLFVGALIVLTGIVLYFFGDWQVEHSAFSFVWVGMLGIFLGLLQPLLLTVDRSFFRVFSSSFLATGTFLVLVGVDELANNAFVDVFLVFLSVYWLVTRISLSQWEHEKICSSCSLASCGLGRTKMGV